MRFLIAVVVLGFPALLGSQPGPYQRVIVEHHVREYLAIAWDSAAHNPEAAERPYCIRYRPYAVVATDSSAVIVFRVDSIWEPFVRWATPYAVNFVPCRGDQITSIHVHTPNTCIPGFGCVKGGFDAFQCEPSRLDVATLKTFRYPFAGIQCSREAISFHFLKPWY